MSVPLSTTALRPLLKARTLGFRRNAALATFTRRSIGTASRAAESTAANARRGVQAWQAALLGGIVVIAAQGALLYANTPTLLEPQRVQAGPSTRQPPDPAKALQRLETALRAIQDANVETSTVAEVLQGYATAPGTSYPPSLPLAVVYPKSTQDVVAIVNACRESRVPIIPISGRTSLEGQTLAVNQKGSAILISFDQMNEIIEVNQMNGDAIVQPGVQWEALNEHLADQGIPLFFPIDPGPGAAFGGMIGCGGSGTAAVRFGSMKGEYIVNATVVLPSGEVIKTRSRARKSAMGYDATKLFIGAEGTLGIVTECTVRLAPKTPIKVATTCFPSVDDAVRTVVDLLNKGVQVNCVELLDDVTMKAINMSGQMAKVYPEKPHLFIKFSGGPGSMSDNIQLTNEVLRKHKGETLQLARDEAENEEIWQARKGLFFSQQLLVPGCKVYITDACVPLSRLPELVEETARDIRASGFVAPILGHSGDGNIHAAILYRPDQAYADVKDLARRISRRAIALEGTASGEHGVGQSKIEFMEPELGPGTVNLMRTIKAAIDPLDLLNPGKLLPEQS